MSVCACLLFCDSSVCALSVANILCTETTASMLYKASMVNDSCNICHARALQAATELSVPASAAASPVSHKDTGGAHMSQELPSFHDWSQAGSLSSAFVTSAAVTSTTITSHPRPQAADSAPQLPAERPVQPQQQLPEAAEAVSDGLSQQEGVPDELMVLQSEAAQQAAVALDPPVGLDDRQQGMQMLEDLFRNFTAPDPRYSHHVKDVAEHRYKLHLLYSDMLL